VSSNTSPARERARIARCSRQFGPSAPETAAARRDHAAARLEEVIRKVVDSAPPLTPEQVDLLSGLLSGGAA